MNFRAVIYILGLLLCGLACSMAVPMMIDFHYGNPDWNIFFVCFLITAYFGGTMVLTTAGKDLSVYAREGFMIICSGWVVTALFAAIPFWFSELGLSFTDSLFEAVSAVTTTGATILTDLQTVPRGILMWRALLQWLGGIGIIITALSAFPFLKIGGMELFYSGSSEYGKTMPHATKLAGLLAAVYICLTGFCILAYQLAGLKVFESVAHALATVSTGGFTIHDGSFSVYDTRAPLIAAIIFMILGSLPFMIYLKILRRPFWQNTQVRWFFSLLMIAAASLAIGLAWQGHRAGQSLLLSVFHTTSVMTGTGFYTENYSLWGGFASSLFLFLMVIGGCAGSTTGGIKVFRFQILYNVARVQMAKLLYPHGLFNPRYAGKPVPDSTLSSVMSFFFIYATFFCLVAITLTFSGLDLMTALSGAAASISNVGPGLGEVIGPGQTYTALPVSAKWILCGSMLAGRLEIFTFLVLFSSDFWRR